MRRWNGRDRTRQELDRIARSSRLRRDKPQNMQRAERVRPGGEGDAAQLLRFGPFAPSVGDERVLHRSRSRDIAACR